MNQQPVTINNIDEIECPKRKSNTIELVEKLKKKIFIAQRQLELSDNNDNDKSRLMRCIGSLLADRIVHNFTYRLFGFTSLIEQSQFMNVNCRVLYTIENIQNLTLANMIKMLDNTIKAYVISEETTIEDKTSANLLRDAFTKFNYYSWQTFTSCLKNVTSSPITNDIFNILTTCTKNLIELM